MSVKKISIGSQIKSYRIKLKLTQQELAERSELSLPFMNLVENDKRNLSVETLLKILDGLEISPSEFFLPFSEDISPDLSELVGKLQTNQNSDKYINIFNNILDIPNWNWCNFKWERIIRNWCRLKYKICSDWMDNLWWMKNYLEIEIAD